MEKEISDFNQTPSANRPYIGFFGRRNAGKSSLVNAVTGQALSIVSQMKGTTTDPVKKAMELLPLGPVVIIDTPGIDDTGQTGRLRVERAFDVLAKTDMAVLVMDSSIGITSDDLSLMAECRKRNVPFIVVFNKVDAVSDPANFTIRPADGYENCPYIAVSAKTGQGINLLKEKISRLAKPAQPNRYIIGDKLKANDVVILVTPIDASAPKGRLILPQVQTIRDVLDAHATCLVTQPDQLSGCLSALKLPPALIITDSQVFDRVKNMIPETVKLTSFSILMARLKGILPAAVEGAHALSALQDGDTILISEGCTHHRQCEDIGTVKLPRWIEAFTGKKLHFCFTSGGDFPKDLSSFSLIVHCGGCMLNEREMSNRMTLAEEAGIPFTNYGTLIAQINGILDRSLAAFE
ncbi:MAG: [FeFe] hydrogenase H-cluster maturation GTPase HydF [Emergencia sp.]|nr:[FeFe] hydrogenase H-cluster maturation GTPase HydF [Emergencia sp.]